MDIAALIADRSRRIDASGIRRVFELAQTLTDPINLSIGQPDYPVPEPIKRAAIDAIERDRNGYTVTQGVRPLVQRIEQHLAWDLGWTGFDAPDGPAVLATSGTSGALVLLAMALLGPGDEFICPDPYFVMYPHLATMFDATAVLCDTYPDFRMTADRVEPLITERTKFLLVNSPSNPCGVVLSRQEQADLLDLCRRNNVLLVSDEIYDEFTFVDALTDPAAGDPRELRCPSAARLDGAQDDVLLIRGFGKTYGVTGWRMGYAAGPRALMHELGKLQQYTYVCPSSVAQWGCLAAFEVDMARHVLEYQRRRDLVVKTLGRVTDVKTPGGAFYAFVKAPDGVSGTEFAEKAVRQGVLVIPGGVFSQRDTHFRVSFATDPAKLERGLDELAKLF